MIDMSANFVVKGRLKTGEAFQESSGIIADIAKRQRS